MAVFDFSRPIIYIQIDKFAKKSLKIAEIEWTKLNIL